MSHDPVDLKKMFALIKWSGGNDGKLSIAPTKEIKFSTEKYLDGMISLKVGLGDMEKILQYGFSYGLILMYILI